MYCICSVVTYNLILTENTTHPDYIGQYLVTVTPRAIQLTNVDSGSQSWQWQLEHIRRFHLERKATKSILLIETGRYVCVCVGGWVCEGTCVWVCVCVKVRVCGCVWV